MTTSGSLGLRVGTDTAEDVRGHLIALLLLGSFAALGIDERAFLPGHLEDYTHPTAAGYELTAAAWKAVIEAD